MLLFISTGMPSFYMYITMVTWMLLEMVDCLKGKLSSSVLLNITFSGQMVSVSERDSSFLAREGFIVTD